jgi:hypothetical protein
MKIPVKVEMKFKVPAGLEAAFELLADVPRSISHFPKLKKLVPQGDEVYRWEMEPMGAMGISHQVIYACRYESDSRQSTVIWVPVPKVGNGLIEGRWQLRADGSGTHIDFETYGQLDVPVPALLRPMAQPYVQGMFRGEVEIYLKNIGRTLGV